MVFTIGVTVAPPVVATTRNICNSQKQQIVLSTLKKLFKFTDVMYSGQIDSIYQVKVKCTSLQNFIKIGYVVSEFKDHNNN